MLTAEEVRHIAKLANLSLTEAEAERLGGQLSEVINYIELLNELRTEEVAATSQVSGIENVFRDDELEKSRSLSPSEALKNAPQSDNSYFVVPAIFGNEQSSEP